MTCVSCARGWQRDNGKIGCGAPVDDAVLQGRAKGVVPIWAERKYGLVRMMHLLVGDATAPPGSDCDNMDPYDGADCKMWQSKGE